MEVYSNSTVETPRVLKAYSASLPMVTSHEHTCNNNTNQQPGKVRFGGLVCVFAFAYPADTEYELYTCVMQLYPLARCSCPQGVSQI